MIYTAIMGHGTVGSGVAELLINESARITSAVREDVEVKYILDLRDFEGLSYSDKFIKDFNIILNDESVKVVAEVMGGVNPAYDFVKSCLLAGKSVVTSNKELVATHGTELLQLARERNLNYLFEASVGGGIPIIRPLFHCYVSSPVKSICGILNGTTNYILHKMSTEGMEYEEALKDIKLKIKILMSDPLTQSRIYRIEYQKTLQKQIEAALEKLHSDEYSTIQQYLSDSYTDGFVGTMYDIHGQGVPVIAPIDQNAAIKAVMTDTKLKKKLYDAKEWYTIRALLGNQ